VLCQSYQNLEILVVDDGSVDNTEDVVKSLKDKRVNYCAHDRNRGAGAARNTGIRNSQGNFIAFQDSDDEWVPQKLGRHMEIFARPSPELGVVYSDMVRIHPDGTESYHRSPTIVDGSLIDPSIPFYQVSMLGIQSAVIRRECLEKAGYFDERFPCLEDLDLFIRLSRICKFHHIREPLVRYHATKGLSADLRAKYAARRLLFETYKKDLFAHHKDFVAKELAFFHISKSLEEEFQEKASP
jgi:glycosyltransferase involved in cell wall biosynthesis